MAETTAIAEKLAKLRARIAELGSVLVCYSGGVDSAFVLAVAHEVLGPRAIGMTAVSPSLATTERDEAIEVAKLIGADHRLVDSDEIEDPALRREQPGSLLPLQERALPDRRGQSARSGASRPSSTGRTRTTSVTIGPASRRRGSRASRARSSSSGSRRRTSAPGRRRSACPFGTSPRRRVCRAACLMGRASRASGSRRSAASRRRSTDLGFRQVRVRYHDELARIELALAELPRAAEPAVSGRHRRRGQTTRLSLRHARPRRLPHRAATTRSSSAKACVS